MTSCYDYIYYSLAPVVVLVAWRVDATFGGGARNGTRHRIVSHELLEDGRACMAIKVSDKVTCERVQVRLQLTYKHAINTDTGDLCVMDTTHGHSRRSAPIVDWTKEGDTVVWDVARPDTRGGGVARGIHSVVFSVSLWRG